MKGLSFFVDDQQFAVDATRVEKIIRKMMITKVPAAPDAVAGVTNLKGRIVTVFCLTALLGRRNEANPAAAGAIVFKPLADGGSQMGLLIDRPGALIELDDEAIQPPSLATGAEESCCITGIVETGGALYRIIDIDSIINTFKTAGESGDNNTDGGLDNAADD